MDKMEGIKNFAGGLAHDINNLLTGILGFSSLLKESSDKGSQIESYAAEIEKSGLKLKDIVDKMMLINMKRTCVKKRVALSGIIDKSIVSARKNVPEIKAVETDIGIDMPGIDADPDKLSQALVCLMGHMSYRSGGRLLLSAEYPASSVNIPGPGQPENQEFVRLSIRASGMPEHDRRELPGDGPAYTSCSHIMLGYEVPFAFQIIANHGGFIKVDFGTPGSLLSSIWLPSR